MASVSIAAPIASGEPSVMKPLTPSSTHSSTPPESLAVMTGLPALNACSVT